MTHLKIVEPPCFSISGQGISSQKIRLAELMCVERGGVVWELGGNRIGQMENWVGKGRTGGMNQQGNERMG